MSKLTKTTHDTLNLAFEQMQEDRETIKDSYSKFADQMENLNDYAVNGANVNKCLELLTKQTAQLLELAKLQSSLKQADDNELSGRDFEGVYNLIKPADGPKLVPRSGTKKDT
jgi:Tfp pilus assembly protein PilO